MLWEKEKLFVTGKSRKHCGKGETACYDEFLLFPQWFQKTYTAETWKQGLVQEKIISVVNPFPNTPFWDHPKFKEAADDIYNVAINGFKDTGCIENIVEKDEIAHFEQFVEKDETVFSLGF